MRMFIKYLCVGLALTFAMTGFAGCGSPQSSENESERESVSVENVLPTEEKAVIASNGESEYTIVVAADYYKNENIKSFLTEIRSLIKQKTGAELNITTDRLITKEEDKANPAILIGPTSFDESAAHGNAMRLYDFYVEYVGNKIVIYSEYVEGAAESLSYFKRLLNDQTAIDKTLYFDKAFQIKSDKVYRISSIACGGIQLGEYSIVLSENATANEEIFAYKLRYHLSTNYGYVLPVTTDVDAASSHEIIIGAARSSDLAIGENCYSIAVNEGIIHFLAKDLAGYLGMFDYVETELFSPKKSECVLDNGYRYSAVASGNMDDGTRLLTQNNGDVRVILYNCLGLGDMTLRHPIQAEIVEGYSPDVVGFQEFMSYCYQNFSPMLESVGYTWLETSAGKSDCTPIFYKAERVTPVEWGYQLYSGANNSNSKSATWCVFQDNDTEKLFAVVSTHFMYNAPSITDDEARETRKSNATELVALINGILEKYPNLPLIAGGDMNCKIGQEEAHTILADSGLIHARDTAQIKNDVRTHAYGAVYDASHKTYVRIPAAVAGYGSSVDHAYATAQTNVQTFCTLVDPYSLVTSDHMPLLMDFSFESRASFT
ncbi:MAG: hypothetical protein IKC59_08600 [Clostridia bacterium]|nr:hypothetical protein [Clostridia bacterium]